MKITFIFIFFIDSGINILLFLFFFGPPDPIFKKNCPVKQIIKKCWPKDKNKKCQHHFNLHCYIEAVVYIVNASVQNRILWGLFVVATLNFLGFIVIWGCQDN